MVQVKEAAASPKPKGGIKYMLYMESSHIVSAITRLFIYFRTQLDSPSAPFRLNNEPRLGGC